MRPNFLVIGAMKSGTTSLYNYLRAHPQVFMPKLKEVDFFTEELNWHRGFQWYERHFASAQPTHVAIGEASTSYTKYPRYAGVAERISEHLPGARLVYVVRDPIQRIRSHYQHNVALGEEDRSIDEAIRTNPAYIDYSRYALQARRYLSCFPQDQLLIITSEDLRHSREATMRRVFDFLAVDSARNVSNLDQEFYKTAERPTYGPVVGSIRRTLKERFPRSVGLWRGRFLPSSVKTRLGRSSGHEERPASVSEQTRAELARALREDVAELRSYMRDGFDGWGLA